MATKTRCCRPQEGERFLGGEFGVVPFYVSGILVAMDMHTNTIVWQQRLSDRCYSGTLATAGGLVFLGRNDGRLTALDSSDGSLLWEFQTGAGMNSPVSAFEQDGKQYIVAYSAGNLFAGSTRGDSVWLFSLDGALDEIVPATEPSEFAAAANRTADLANGGTLYNAACTFCHGSRRRGRRRRRSADDGDEPRQASCSRFEKGLNAMPPFGAALTPEQIHDISTYVVEELPH